MKQIYHNYNLWEDYQNGMWKKVSKEEEDDILPIAIEFMSNHIKFGEAMMNVINNWVYTCEQNLTDASIYHKPFIGQCAVCYELGIPEYITRLAWNKLTDEQQLLANKQAGIAIRTWKKKHIKKNQNYVNKELFK
jgi:hypothetical protein